jgi:hypothetical protein
MEQITVGNREINYTIIRSNRKTVGLVVDLEKGVIIRAPRRLTNSQIKEVVKKKSSWIIKKLKEVRKIKPAPEVNFISGEEIFYLGGKYRLKVMESDMIKKTRVKYYQGEFQIEAPPFLDETERRSSIRQEMVKWYKDQARVKIEERVRIYQDKMGVCYNKITVKEQKKRWGSCSSKGNLNFNWRLIMAPVSVIDYIVVHELAHLVHPNHSTDFWELVKAIIPDYKERQEWLKVNGNCLSI